MDIPDFDTTCPKCGHEMRMVPESDWHLYELASVDYICPNCMHVERHEYIVAERARREER